MTKENETWWDKEIENHEAYGGSMNFRGKEFVAWYLSADESILDVGCGNGLLLKAFFEKDDEPVDYKGIDLSYKMIEAAKGLYPGMPWEVGDANDIKEKDESWDNVVLFHVIECMENYEKPIQEALRVAKKKVVVVFWKGLQLRDNHIIKESLPNNYESMFSAKLFFEFLRKEGYMYPQWVELYVDEFRYNLYFVLDKEKKRVEISLHD